MGLTDSIRSVVVALLAGTFLATMAGGVALAAQDVAVWVYGAHRWSLTETATELSRLPEGTRRLYLSVEDGSRLLLDDPSIAIRLGEILEIAHDRFGMAVEAMLLQDSAWASDQQGAIRRISRVLAFQRERQAAGRPAFRGLHLDVEPHTEEAWICGDARERGAMVRNLQALFARIGQTVRAEDAGLLLTAALPWWLGPLSAEVPAAAPATWLADIDEVVLMVYGEPGGPLVGRSPAEVLARVDDSRLWVGLPPGRGLRVGLAAHEYPDRAALTAAARQVVETLTARPGFRGIALFAHGERFDAPLVTSVDGRVVDRTGRPVPGARVRAGDQVVPTNRCGRFALRGLPGSAIEITADADGFAPTRVKATGLIPGRQQELRPMVLERAAR